MSCHVDVKQSWLYNTTGPLPPCTAGRKMVVLHEILGYLFCFFVNPGNEPDPNVAHFDIISGSSGHHKHLFVFNA